MSRAGKGFIRGTAVVLLALLAISTGAGVLRAEDSETYSCWEAFANCSQHPVFRAFVLMTGTLFCLNGYLFCLKYIDPSV